MEKSAQVAESTDLDDRPWAPWRAEWDLPDQPILFTCGSCAIAPRQVMDAWAGWIRKLNTNHYTPLIEPWLEEARTRLAAFVGSPPADFSFMLNTTMGVHAVAGSLRLQAGDEVILNNHEYGINTRIFQRACEWAGARLVIRPLPWPIRSEQEVLEAMLGGVSSKTRLVVIDHVTSPTAVVLPVEAVCREARKLGVSVLVDGAHGLALRPLDLKTLDCDYYASSCHKWLNAPPGAGFLYVQPRMQEKIVPLVVNWGKKSWRDVWWCGTRDFSPFLSVPAALDFLQRVGLEAYRRRTHALARYFRERMTELTGLEPAGPTSRAWSGAGGAVPVHSTDDEGLQKALEREHGLRLFTGRFEDHTLVRPSFHLYHRVSDVDRLVDALVALGATKRK